MEIAYEKGLTFEKVWAMFQEDRKRLEKQEELWEKQRLEEEKRREIERAERVERDKKNEEEWIKFRKELKEINKNIGGITNTMGEWVEGYFQNQVSKRFKAMGYIFTEKGNKTFENPDGTKYAEVDNWLENSDCVMAIEVKSIATIKNIEDHIERMQKIANRLKEKGDSREVLASVAAMNFKQGVEELAKKNGMFVITQSGENLIIEETPEGWTPKNWNS
jgi:hypothetical protein